MIALVLVGINALFSPQDLGWSRINPSPMLMLPLLIGCRYGFNAGIIAGFVAGLPLFIQVNLFQTGGLQSLMENHGFYFSTLIVIGGVCGEIQHNLRLNQLKLEKENESQNLRMRALNEENEFIRAVNSELERMLATRDSELSTLDSELRRLFDSEPGNLFQDFLFLLNRQCRVSEAAVYAWDVEGESLKREAAIGNQENLPREIQIEQREMLALAASKKTVVALPDQFLKTGKREDDFLLVVPIFDSSNRIVSFLVIQDMPFISFERSNIQLIYIITKWVGRMMEIHSDSRDIYRVTKQGLGQKIFYPDYFKRVLQLALDSYHQNRLPSSVVTFWIHDSNNEKQSILESQVIRTMRSGDFPCVLDLNTPHLVVLLPLSGERGADIFMKRIVGICDHHPDLKGRVQSRVIAFHPGIKCSDLWNQLHAMEQKESV